jgi:hypothetical protein
MDVWEIPQSSRSRLDSGFLMDVGQERAMSWLPFECIRPVNAVRNMGSLSSSLSVLSISGTSLTMIFPGSRRITNPG